MKYTKWNLGAGKWAFTESGHDYRSPAKACTFAWDTETQVLFDGKILETKKLAKRIKNMNESSKRKHIENVTWAWQAYDEANGFFMTNSFEDWLFYLCRAGYSFGWDYNATFDFAQVDWAILSDHSGKWKPHEKGTSKGYDKGQAWTYESTHNDMGARYAYKLWVPYRNANRHEYVHAVEFRDFMKFLSGGLKRVLEDLDVRDGDGAPIRKLSMEYQAVDIANPTAEEVEYCAVDVKGLYFAVKTFNETIEAQSDGECSIYGKATNLMTAGGFAKRELLRAMYPEEAPKARLKTFQKKHPLSVEQDHWLRENHLYRGGISFVNPRYRGRLLTAEAMGRKMNRYDVNSEYPYAMAIIWDLAGTPFKEKYSDYLKRKDKENFECALLLTSVTGRVKEGYLGLWYDPFKKEYVEEIDEEGNHLMFKEELDEMANWYDIEYTCDYVILWRRGTYSYRPYVLEKYEAKAKAKREGNRTLLAVSKLLLNSAYGKLAERVERREGHYEISPKTGAVHFVEDGEEVEAKSAMNVAVGALVTATARVFILSKIREICHGDKMAQEFVYIDTDSIHAFADYEKADPLTLGGLKLEATCEAVKYLAPKTYVDIDMINKDGTIEAKWVEVHSKGVTTASVTAELAKRQKGKRKGKATLDLIDRKINYGIKYLVLVAMNVRGGKVLLPTFKYLATEELRPKDCGEPLFYSNAGGGSYLVER